MKTNRAVIFLVWLLYLSFVIYGSLIPFDFHMRRVGAAWEFFRHLPYRELSIAGRADLAANLVLYTPLGFFLFAFLQPGILSRFKTFAALVATLAVCSFIAISIEFVQLFFPPRTVSLNDILAEITGSVAGVTLCVAFGATLSRLWSRAAAGGGAGIYAGLILYLVTYVALSLFPFDFLLSTADILWKIESTHYDWLFSESTCGQPLRCTAKLIAETVAVIPIGILLGMSFTGKRSFGIGLSLIAGILLGFTIEALQFFLVSGITQGASVLTRVIGVVLGAEIFRAVTERGAPRPYGRGTSHTLRRAEPSEAYPPPPRLRTVPSSHSSTGLHPWLSAKEGKLDFSAPCLRPLILLGGLLYITLLTILMWSGKGSWLRVDEGFRRLTEINLLPFYYHYYTSEPLAMFSLTVHSALFFPVGVGYWVWSFASENHSSIAGVIVPAFLGGVIAMVVEAGKLFLTRAHPDPTDVLIGAAAAVAGYIVTARCANSILHTESSKW